MSMTETELASGRVVAIAGPVIDVEFPVVRFQTSTLRLSSTSSSMDSRNQCWQKSHSNLVLAEFAPCA